MKSPEELLKAGQEAESERDRCFGPFRLKPVERTLWGPSGPVQLTPKEFDTLDVLVKSIGKPVSTQTILALVWHDTTVDPNNVPQVIGRLRRKLGKNDTGQDYILTLPNVGYVLSAIDGTGPSVAESENPIANSRESDAIVAPPGNPVRIPSPASRGLVYILILLLIVLGGFLYLSVRGHKDRLLVWETANVTHDRRPKRGPVLFDGSRIWFEEEVEGTWRVVSVDAEGGETTPLQIPLAAVRLQDIAVDGSALLISATDGDSQTLWSWPLLGGDPQMLRPQAGEAAWAPDKRSLAFASTNRLILAPATAPTSFTAMPSGDVIFLPRWSPGGEHITFQLVDRKTGESHLWLADHRGGDVRPVPGAKDTGEDQARGIWTRDGRYYVFAGGSRTSHDLWVLRSPEGFFGLHLAKPSRLTHGPVNWDWPTPGRNTGELFAMGESVQGKLVSLTRPGSMWHPYLGGIPAYELDFSRDGVWVVYVRYPDHSLWKSRVDGSQRVQLTSSTEVEVHQPHWSPDGNRIAFMGQKPGASWRVMILKPGGKIEEPLPGSEDQGVPTWSPDGRNLLFGDWAFGKNTPPMRLHILDLFSHRAAPMEGSETLWTPRWSPDGAYISALRQNSKSLMLTRAGKSSWREIVTGEDLDDPTWSLDSRNIFLTAQALHQLRRVNILTGKVEQLADLRDFPFTREQWFGVAPDGSSLALQAFPEQEIYSLHWVLP